ncbi:MAG: 50S ribosomal protein L6 [Firmicutes bacterium ADurb.Bin248]|nr:MAG: 50S ribosomal protein L6 [Firmicutes bacterium ADurb.Bin248]HOG00098.1 50S ribosomal protein L6 [Clostridia bacterium]
MSRIGKLPINVPAGVTITVDDDNTVTVKGPKGTLTDKFADSMEIAQDAGVVHIKRASDEKQVRALHGLTRSLLHNMVVGVTEGFKKDLEIEGVGYKAQLTGNKLVLNMGYSHPVEIEAPGGISFEVPAPNRITVRGIDKQRVGQIAADIRKVRTPSPYVSKQGAGKGIKYAGEKVRRKVGKTK